MTERGERFNTGKLRWHLLPWDGVRALVDIFDFGTTEYAPRNWEKGLSYSETFDSLQRHLLSWYSGEDYDPKSRRLHLAHVTWNALALLTFTLRGRTDLDDRPKAPVAQAFQAPLTQPETYEADPQPEEVSPEQWVAAAVRVLKSRDHADGGGE